MLRYDGQLLIAHGSSNARWRVPFETMTHALATRHPGRAIRLCYLEKSQPDVPTALDDLYRQGCRRLRVSPLFISHGRHLEHDLPRLLDAYRQKRPDVFIEAEEALGEQRPFLHSLIDLLA